MGIDFEKLNDSIDDAEDAIHELGFPVRAEVSIYADDEYPKLGYGKIYGDWRLLVIYEASETPLREASLEIRVAASRALLDLRRALETRQTEMRQQVESAADLYKTFADEVA